MSNIGLVDVDGHNFPNLALMKISTYHKQRGDSVEWAFSLLPYDKIYMAKVFTLAKPKIRKDVKPLTPMRYVHYLRLFAKKWVRKREEE